MPLFSPNVIDLGEVELNTEIKHSNGILSNKLVPVDESLPHNFFSHPKMDHCIDSINKVPKTISILVSHQIHSKNYKILIDCCWRNDCG